MQSDDKADPKPDEAKSSSRLSKQSQGSRSPVSSRRGSKMGSKMSMLTEKLVEQLNTSRTDEMSRSPKVDDPPTEVIKEEDNVPNTAEGKDDSVVSGQAKERFIKLKSKKSLKPSGSGPVLATPDKMEEPQAPNVASNADITPTANPQTLLDSKTNSNTNSKASLLDKLKSQIGGPSASASQAMLLQQQQLMQQMNIPRPNFGQFQQPDNGMTNIPEREQYQMYNLDFNSNPLPQRPKEKHILSNDARIIREEMVGYVDAVLERQDRADCLKKIESFQIETASRRALRDLVDHFLKLDTAQKEKTAAVKEVAETAKKRTDTQDLLIKKLQQAVQEIGVLNKKIQVIEQRAETVNINNTKKFDAVREKIENTKVYLETKIDTVNMLEDKFIQNKADIRKVQELMLKTKQELFVSHSELKLQALSAQAKMDAHEQRLDQTISDTKYWLDKYTKTYQENDKAVQGVRTELNGRIETLFYQLGRRVTVDDMRKNFKALNDMMFIKFKQLEDTKTAVRDMIVYQKHFYPMQMQSIIGENMMHCAAAVSDQGYVQYQQRKYEEYLDDIELQKKLQRTIKDADLMEHFNELDKHHLHVSDWTMEPLDNVDHDFVNDLLKRYLKDLQYRQRQGNPDSATFTGIMRKGVQLTELEEIVNKLYVKTAGLKKEADRKENELENKRLIDNHNRKVSKLINNKIEFKKNKAFKRQNSYTPMLDAFGDIDDHDQIQDGVKATRRSIQMKRQKQNPIVKDVTSFRLERDILMSETVGESARYSQTGSQLGKYGTQNKMRTTGRQTKDGFNQSLNNTGSFQVGGGNVAMGGQVQMVNGMPMMVMQGPNGQPMMMPMQMPMMKGPGGQAMATQTGVPLPEGGKSSRSKSMSPSPGGAQPMMAQMMPMMAPGGLPAGQILNSKGQPQMMIPGQANMFMDPGMMVQKDAGLDAAERRKLIKDVKDEVKPLISQIADYQIEKANQVLKTQLRKLENELVIETQRINDKIDREIKITQQKAESDLKIEVQKLEEAMRTFQKQRARDKSDNDLKHNQHVAHLQQHEDEIRDHGTLFDSLAKIITMLIENVNMQIEAECADLIDRRMMSLFGVSESKVDKLDVSRNASKTLREAKRGFQSPTAQSPALPKVRQRGQSRDFNFDLDSKANGLSPNPSGDTISAQVQDKSCNHEKKTLMKEYAQADRILKDTGKLPISVDQKCLMCMQSGRDTSHVLRLFKTACLSYAPSEVTYRKYTMTRNALTGMRRELVEKIEAILPTCSIFKEGAIYPRRYFDDLILEQQMAFQQSQREVAEISKHGSFDESQLQALLSSKMPFGIAKNRSGAVTMNNSMFKTKTSQSHANHDLIAQGISEDDTHGSSRVIMPEIANKTPIADKNFILPGTLILDTDSALNLSQHKLRQQMSIAQTARAANNRTYDQSPISQLAGIEVGGGLAAKKTGKNPSERTLDDIIPSTYQNGKFSTMAHRSARKHQKTTSLVTQKIKLAGVRNNRSPDHFASVGGVNIKGELLGDSMAVDGVATKSSEFPKII